jgi:hypothetical protein
MTYFPPQLQWITEKLPHRENPNAAIYLITYNNTSKYIIWQAVP